MANIVLAVLCLVMDISQSLVLLVFDVADVANLVGGGWWWCVDIDSNGNDNDNGANIVVALDFGVAFGVDVVGVVLVDDVVFINPLLIKTIFFLRSLQLVFILNSALYLCFGWFVSLRKQNLNQVVVVVVTSM